MQERPSVYKVEVILPWWRQFTAEVAMTSLASGHFRGFCGVARARSFFSHVPVVSR